ncbi:MAG TPA: glycosyltransferase [Candidatus Eisenbacteria bacterium]|nr:glycosyltransferase [Candidatus Eisenbacteria bacterium]
MKIGIDISQLAYQGTGVATYLTNLVQNLVQQDKENEYILFYSSMRKNFQFSIFNFQSNSKVQFKIFKFPPTFLNILWNKLHLVPIEWLIGPVDVFISSDWTQPPTKAKKVTILYDMIVYTYPQETDAKIVKVQKARLEWVKKEVERIICISKATKKDAMEILGIPEKRLAVIYPGI